LNQLILCVLMNFSHLQRFARRNASRLQLLFHTIGTHASSVLYAMSSDCTLEACVPILCHVYSTDIFSAAPVAQGAKTRETINVAPNKNSQACGLVPFTLARTAPLPKMSTGI